MYETTRRRWSKRLSKSSGDEVDICFPNRTIEKEFTRDYSYISKAVDFSVERKLACPSHLIDVFNDTAVITFPSNSLNGLPQSTWAESPEPQYPHSPDLEIILKETQS